jgi:ankyrin repeat protein
MTLAPVRIFLSSPSDLRPERAASLRLIARLNSEFAHHFRVEAVMWEQEPLVASAHFQDPENIPPPSTADIVVVMVWSRLGVFLPTRFTGRLSGRQPVTGTEWEFEDALAAARAHRKPDLLAYRKTAPIAARLDDPELDTHRAAKHALDAFIAQWFRDGEGGGFTAALHDVADEAELLAQLEQHLRALLLRRLRPEAGQAPRLIQWHQGSPFRGLEVFEAEHEPVFFGRTRARIELRAALAHQAAHGCAFVLLAGASGCGKSSLVRAGLLSDLRLPGMIGNVALLRHAILRVDDSGSEPLAALAAAMLRPEALPELAALGYDASELVAQLLANPAQIGFILRQAMLELHRNSSLTTRGEPKLLLVVDQLEALFTREGLTDAVRTPFVAVLEAAARSGSAFVVATLRSDFSDRIETLPGLAALAAGRGRYTLLPPDAIEIGQIIRLPARESGLTFEVSPEGAALDDALQRAAAGPGDSLPLLEFALQQLWERCQGSGGMLSWDAYRAMGELEGAIGARGEAELAKLPDAAQAALPALLRALATIDLNNGRAVSRRLPMASLPVGTPLRILAETFLAARLLVTAEGGLLRVAHEALLTRWPRAATHLAEDRRDLALRARLEAAAALWLETPEDARAQRLLPAGLPVQEAAALLVRRPEMLEPATADFVAISLAGHEADAINQRAKQTAEAHRRRRFVRMGFVTSVVTIAALSVLLVHAQNQTHQAHLARQRADRDLVTSERTIGESRRAFRMVMEELDVWMQRQSVDNAGIADLLPRLRERLTGPAGDLLGQSLRDEMNARLIAAAADGSIAVATALLDAGAEPDATDADSGRTALFEAALNGRSNTTALLINRGARSDRRNRHGMTAAFAAASLVHEETLLTLISNGTDANEKMDNGLGFLHAIAALRPDGSTEFFNQDLANQRASSTPRSAPSGNPARLISTLLARGVEVNARASNGDTPLHVAIRAGNTSAAEALLNAGADPTLLNLAGFSGFAFSAAYDREEIIKFMLKIDRIRDSFLNDTIGYHILGNAAVNGRARIVRLLSELGVPFNARALPPHQTPLMLAVESGNLETVEALLDAGADIDARNENGETSLHKAARRDQVEIFRALISRGASVDYRSYIGDNPLTASSGVRGARGVELARLAIGAGVDPNQVDGPRMEVALIGAIAIKNHERLIALLELGASPDPQGTSVSPLAAAIALGDQEAAALLRRAGADQARAIRERIRVFSDPSYWHAGLYLIAPPVDMIRLYDRDLYDRDPVAVGQATRLDMFLGRVRDASPRDLASWQSAVRTAAREFGAEPGQGQFYLTPTQVGTFIPSSALLNLIHQRRTQIEPVQR